MTNETQETLVLSTDYLLAVTFSIVQLLGVSGNALVICSIYRTRNLLNNNYYFLVLHLAICDLVCLLFYLRTASEVWSPNSSFIRSIALCKIWSPSATLFFMAGIHLMVLISVLRHRAVACPLKPAVSRWKIRIIVLLVHIFALICLIPYVLVLRFTDRCFEKWSNPSLNLSYTLFLSAVQYFIPLAILSMLYFKICYTLTKQNKLIDTMVSTRAAAMKVGDEDQTYFQRIKYHRNIRTFITSGAIVVCYGVTAFPSQIYSVLFATGVTKENDSLELWLSVVSWRGTSAANPFTYGITDKTLLSAYKRSWKRLKATFRLG